jgi:hypothetical protein
MMQIAFWNSNGLSSRYQELTLALHASPRIHILFISETKLYSTDLIPQLHSDYTSYSFPHPLHSDPTQSRAGGMVAFIHTSVRHCFRHHLSPPKSASFNSSTQIIWVELGSKKRNSKQPLLIGSIYLAPNAPAPDQHLIYESIKNASNYSSTLIVGGDFNAHHPLWDNRYPIPNVQGTNLHAAIIQHSFNCVNSSFIPDASTFIRPNAESVLDLCLTTHPAIISNMSLHDHPSFPASDHKPIFIEVQSSAHSPHAVPPPIDPIDKSHTTWIFEKANWPLFQTKLQLLLSENAFLIYYRSAISDLSPSAPNGIEIRQHLIDDMTTSLNDSILAAATLSIPTKHISVRSKHYFNDPSVLPAIRKKNAALRRFRAFRTCPIRRSNWYQARDELKHVLTQAQANSLQQLLEKLQHPDEHGKLLWSVFQKSFSFPFSSPTAPSLGNICNPQGEIPTSFQHSINNLAQFFEHAGDPPSSYHESSDTKHFFRHLPRNLQNDRRDDPTTPISSDDVATMCEKQNCDTSNGPDNISARFIKNGGVALHNALTLVFNFSLTHSIVPSIWRTAHMTCLFKGPPLDPTSSNSYRPISLTSNIIRLFERILLPQLWKQVKSSIHPEQFGFRPEHGTLDALHSLLSQIHASFRSQSSKPSTDHSLPTAFLDLIKAFDRVNHRILLKRLHEYGIIGRLWCWIRAFLTGRSFQVRVGKILSILCDLIQGVPQGSVLAPLLFSIFINPLADLIRRSKLQVKLRLLADDIAITPQIPGPTGHPQLQIALHIADRWAKENSMEFSPSKSALVLFTSQATSHDSASIDSYNNDKSHRSHPIIEIPQRTIHAVFTPEPNSDEEEEKKSISSSPIRSRSLTLRRFTSPTRSQHLSSQRSNSTSASPSKRGDVAAAASPSISASYLTLFPHFILGKFTLPLTFSYKYLGLRLQSDGHWKQQEKKCLQTANLTSQQILRLIPSHPPRRKSKLYSPSLITIRQWVLGYMVPKLSYAMFLWRPTDTFANSINKIIIQSISRVLALPANLSHSCILQQTHIPTLQQLIRRQLIHFGIRSLRLPPEHTTQELYQKNYQQELSFPSLRPKYALSYANDLLQLERSWNFSWTDPTIRTKTKINELIQQKEWSEWNATSDDSQTVRHLQTMQINPRLPAYLRFDHP